jgi:short subunit dehydrogenase-like uncharacterized protein
MAAKKDRPYDIVLFGATSFVGKIICAHMVARHGVGRDLRWAIAGRDAAKLSELAKTLAVNIPTVVVDAADAAGLKDLALSTRVVLSTVGPYALYGTPLVQACAEQGTDYCDLTGEPQWMQAMIDAHHETAMRSGARIVHACGFDSIPSDVGNWFTQQEAVKRFGESCPMVAMRVRALKGGASGGTIASMMNVLDEVGRNKDLRKVLANPYALAPKDARQGVKQTNVLAPSQDKATGQWVAPFVMASVNTRVVFRTNALLNYPWGKEFRYDEATLMGKGVVGAAKAAGLSGGLGAAMGVAAIKPVRDLLGKALPKPGEGPSVEKQTNGFFDIRFFGTAPGGQKIETKVTGDRDPGYGSTAKMIAEAAVCLLHTPASAVAGGFWTPASALGDALIAALTEHAGLRFEVLS